MNVRGKTILVTGSTDGVGRLVAERLGADGARVIVHGRDRARGKAVVERIAKGGGAALFLEADLASLAEVRQLAEAVRHETGGVDVLVNNAGIGTAGDGREISADGFELRFAVNYLAGFLLTRLLLPLIEARAPSRIVNVSSAGQQAIDFDDVMLTHGYSGVRAYCQSMAQILSPRPRRAGGRHGQRAPSGELHGHGDGAQGSPMSTATERRSCTRLARVEASSAPRRTVETSTNGDAPRATARRRIGRDRELPDRRPFLVESLLLLGACAASTERACADPQPAHRLARLGPAA